MKTLFKLALCTLVSGSALQFAQAASQHFASGGGGTGIYDYWQVNVPAGTFSVSYVIGETSNASTAGYGFYNGSINIDVFGTSVYISEGGWNSYVEWSGDTNPNSYVSMQAGIAGPPAGQVYLAYVNFGVPYTYRTDEKWATLAGGTYGIWHTGGVSGSGLVVAVTEISW